MRSEAIKKILEDRSLPIPPGELVDALWVATTEDWWIKTTEGWFCTSRGNETEVQWRSAPFGPPGENP